MLIRCIALVAFLWASPSLAIAQVTLTGNVTDAVTGETLPSTTIQVEGSFTGTITNTEGAYELAVEALPVTLVVRYIGYQTERRTIEAGASTAQDIQLAPVAVQMDELVVSGEDPAPGIMRRVIERKQQWWPSLETYQVDAYTRLVMRNDTGIVSMVESLTEAYWDKERGTREVLKAKRQTNNMSVDTYLPAAQFVINFYDDNIDVSGYEFYGVTHPSALRHYRFSLIDVRQIDDQLVYDIRVEPRNRLKTGFRGRVAVLDEAFALLEVELEPGEAFLFPPPIQRYEVTYRQQYANSGGDVWLPVDLRTDIELDVSFPGLLTFPTFDVEILSRLANYEINVPVLDSLYADDKDSDLVVDTASVAASTALETAGVAVPLSRVERAAYATIDSTMTMAKAYEPSGVLARFVDMEEDEDGASVRIGDEGDAQPGARRLGNLRFRPELWYNRVDEAHLAMEVALPLSERVEVGGLGGYKTGPGEATYGAHVAALLGPKRRTRFQARYEHAIDPRYRSSIYDPITNSIAMVLSGKDYFDYYQNDRLRIGLRHRWPRQDVRASVEWQLEEHASVEQHASFNLLEGDTYITRLNPAVTEGQLQAVRVAVGYGEAEGNWGLVGQRRAQLAVDHAIGGDFDFTRVSTLIEWRFPTFFKRRLLSNALDVQLRASTSRGALPPQRFSIVDASLGRSAPFGTLRTGGPFPFEGDQTVAFYWEHSFRTVPFEILGLRSLAERGYNVILHGAHAASDVRDETRQALRYAPFVQPGGYHELGVGLSGLFSLLRVDTTWRMDQQDFAVTLTAARVF
ncbi:MAG: DUF5686 and carboxypeptidase-like regulatory domain-containing protein [Rhodothermales bacterium]